MKRVVALILALFLVLPVANTALAGRCASWDGGGCGPMAPDGRGGSGAGGERSSRNRGVTIDDLLKAQQYRNAQLDGQIKRAELFNKRVEVVKNGAWLVGGAATAAWAAKKLLR